MYDIRKGWKPLCEFIGVDIPSSPFPYSSVVGKLQEEILDKHPVFQDIYNEVRLAIIGLSVVSVALCYCFCAYHTDSEWFLPQDTWLSCFFEFVGITFLSFQNFSFCIDLF